MVDIDDNNNNEKICNTRLRLGIGTLDDDGDCDDHHHQKQKKISSSKRVTSLDLCFPNEERVRMEEEEGEEERQSITSNNLNNANGDHHHHHHHEDDDNNNSNNGGGGGRSCARKKLRLTQEQSAVLEDSFKLHTTLNTAQKQALSKRLNLKPRQVEVWFQNRRARTKLKQTEVDCEFLKKYCENLRDENIRLKKEVQELRSSSSSSSSSLLLFQENLSKLQNSSTLLCPTCDQKMGNRSTTTSSETDADPDDNVVAVHKSKPRLPNRSGFNFFPNH